MDIVIVKRKPHAYALQNKEAKQESKSNCAANDNSNVKVKV